jgi:hypothetical protein
VSRAAIGSEDKARRRSIAVAMERRSNAVIVVEGKWIASDSPVTAH